MKKKILCGVLIALLVIGAAVLIVFKQKNPDGFSKDGSGQISEEANFDMEYSDRLVGFPVTDYKSNSSTIEVSYGEAGFTRKTLGVVDNSDRRSDLTEETKLAVNGYDVTLRGKGGNWYLAVWTYNSFAYTISINSDREGVSTDEMTDYIKSTR